MPMYQAITFFLLALAIAGAAAALVPRLRPGLAKPIPWLVMLALGAAASAASALVSATRHSGTGFTTSHGWPKPFYFRYLGETGSQSDGLSVLYFLGNTLVFTAALLVLWTIWRLARR